jgi:lysozyme
MRTISMLRPLAVTVLLAACGQGDELGSLGFPVHTVCGSGSTVPGIDVSYYQGTINWASVKAAGKVFAIARVSHGTGTVDTQFATNWPAMKQAGIIRGLYQYFEPADSALAQAQLLVSKLNAAGGLEDGDLPPVLDLEKMGTLSSSQILTAVSTWMTHVKSALGRKPILYTGSYFWDDHGLGTAWASTPLWTAHYTTAACPLVPNAWSSWVIWQHTDKGSVSGITGDVDLDRFNGTAAELTAFIQASKIAPPAPDAAPPKPDAGAPREGGLPPDLAASGELGASDGSPLPTDWPMVNGDVPPVCTNCGSRPSDDAGCACELGEAGRPTTLALLALLLLGLALARRRRGVLPLLPKTATSERCSARASSSSPASSRRSGRAPTSGAS